MDVSKISMPLQVEPAGQVRLPSGAAQSTPNPLPADSPSASSPVSREEVEAAMASLAIKANLKVEMSQDPQTGSDVVRIFSQDGKRLLRQMPPEAVLKIAEGLDQGKGGGLLTSMV